jgi:hypothetical protein
MSGQGQSIPTLPSYSFTYNTYLEAHTPIRSAWEGEAQKIQQPWAQVWKTMEALGILR